MASLIPRPRSLTSGSTTSINTRPKSRQSTTSIASSTTQPAPPYYQETQTLHSADPLSTTYQASAELYAALTAQPTAVNTISSVPHGLPYDIDNNHEFPSRISELLQAQNEQADLTERQGSEAPSQYGDSQINGENGGKRKKGAATSAANDMELRRLFRENEGRDLHEVAQQVLENEKGPKSEKTKQIFGMLWLHANCARAKNESVPRSRVFSSYATGCGTERVPPLNPASFGKLVRIIFPGIQTRRLGIRGESKYHYVELKLIYQEDHPFDQRAQSMVNEDFNGQFIERPRHQSLRPQLSTDNTALFPSTRNTLMSLNTDTSQSNVSVGDLLPSSVLRGNIGSNFSDVNPQQRPLQFQTKVDAPPAGNTQLELPSIRPYLPPGADEDAVSSLTSVYRSHCFLAIDNFRYCKTEKLCDSYKSFIGLLTVPGQKLLANPQMATWIRDCDWLKYQKMTPLLDQTVFTKLPPKALQHIHHVASNLCFWIAQFFQNQPPHVQDAMLAPANQFVSLLERYMRVNRACQDVSIALDNAILRGDLWNDYIACSNPNAVVGDCFHREIDLRLPTWHQKNKAHGLKRTLKILTQEVREILAPSESSILKGDGSIFERIHKPQNQGQIDFLHDPSYDQNMDIDAGAVIDRISSFLRSLPTLFPKAKPAEIIQKVDMIGNAINRNLSLASAQTMGHWWQIKVFVDELTRWLAEIGGFQGRGAESMGRGAAIGTEYTEGMYPFESGDASDFETEMSRPTTGRPVTSAAHIDLSTALGQQANATYTSIYPPQTPKEMTSHDNTTSRSDQKESTVLANEITGADGVPDTHDDSGIAMGDDEFAMGGKYDGFVGGVHGSDPADVVVC